MLTVPEAYRAAVRAPVRTDRLTGVMILTDGETVEFGADDLLSGSVTIDNQCVTGEELQFGCVYMGQAAFQLRTGLSRYRLYGAAVTLTYGLRLADGSWYDLPLGVFTVAEAERTRRCVSIRAYDNMLRLNDRYAGAALQGTPYEILQQIAAACGVALGQSAADLAGWPNAAETFQIDGEDGCDTWRDCAAAVAQLLAGFVTVDRAGRLVVRRFAEAPCASLGPGERQSAAVADYRCRYTALEIQAGNNDYTAADDPDDGLRMTMTDAPLFAKGVEERNQQLADAVFGALRQITYVPATVTLPGDPALECGDRLTLTEPDTESGETAETLITHLVWKFRGAQTVKGVGKNPWLTSAADRQASTLRRLQGESDSNRMIFYEFTNPAAVTVGAGEVQAAGVRFAATENTSVLFTAQLLLTAEVDGTDGTDGAQAALTLTVRYYLNGARLGYAPTQSLGPGAHALALALPLAGVAGGTANTFSVRLAASGGRVRLAAGAVRAVLFGQGMAAAAGWDGLVEAEDTLAPLRFPAPPGFTPGAVDEQQGFDFRTPPADPPEGLETLGRLGWAAPPYALAGLTGEAGAALGE